MQKESSCRPLLTTSRIANTSSMPLGTRRFGHKCLATGSGAFAVGLSLAQEGPTPSVCPDLAGHGSHPSSRHLSQPVSVPLSHRLARTLSRALSRCLPRRGVRVVGLRGLRASPCPVETGAAGVLLVSC